MKNNDAADYLAKLLEDHHFILQKQGGGPPFFVDFRKRDRQPIYTWDPKLAKRFSPEDAIMVAAWQKHLREHHGHTTIAMYAKGFRSAPPKEAGPNAAR